MKLKKHIISLAAILIFAVFNVAARTYYVSPDGNDSAAGTYADPLQTIQAAANSANDGDTVIIREGVYREQIRPLYSGSYGAPITYTAYKTNGVYEKVIISACEELTGWSLYDTLNESTKIYRVSSTITVPLTSIDCQLFVDGVMMVDARWPNVTPEQAVYLKNKDKACSTAGSGRLSQSNTTTKTGWYQTPELESIPDNLFQDAKINFSPGRIWFYYSGNVSSNIGDTIYIDLNNTIHSFDDWANWPQISNFFYVWGRLPLLDTHCEWAREGSYYYLCTPDGSHPSNFVVEVKKREFAFDLRDRSFTHVEGIEFFAGSLNTSAISYSNVFSNLDVKYVGHILNMSKANSTAQQPRVFGINGRWNIVKDSRFRYSATHLMSLSGKNNTVYNSVFSETCYLHGNTISANYQTHWGYLEPPQDETEKNCFRGNTIYNSSYTQVTASQGKDILSNECYNSHAQGTDVGIISSWGADGKNSIIAWNVVHDAPGLLDYSLGFYGGHCIYFDKGTRNFLTHNNITWGATASGIHLMQYEGDGFGSISNCNRKVYQNTVWGKLGYNLWATSSTPGTEIKNNLVREIDDPGSTTNTWELSHNYETTDTNNFVNAADYDFRLASGSGAIDYGEIIPGFTTWYEGSAPDAGAHEGMSGWIAGAVIRPVDMYSLYVTFRPCGASGSVCRVSNLPLGRKLPPDFSIKIGTNDFSGSFVNQTDYSIHSTVGVAYDLPVPAHGEEFPAWIRLGSEPDVFIGTCAVENVSLQSISPSEGNWGGGENAQISGTGFMTMGTPRVLFGGVGSPAVHVSAHDALTAIVPVWTGSVPATVDVVLINPDFSSATLDDAFMFIPEPVSGVLLLSLAVFFRRVRK